MTSDLLFPGLILEVDLPPCLNGCELAGTHPLIVLGYLEGAAQVYGVACTSRSDRKEPTYLLPRGVLALPHDTFVLTDTVRYIERALWCRARRLDQVPRAYLDEIKKKARRALRRKGLAL